MVRLVRSPMEEFKHRLTLRQEYFEDPNYRKWSDIVPGGIGSIQYASWSDDQLFDYLMTGQVNVRSSLTILNAQLIRGYVLPINWSNFYAYFDAQLNDPENRYSEELDKLLISDNYGNRSRIKDLLDKYREQLCNTYDII